MKKPIKRSKFLMLLTFSLGMVVSAIAQERSELALSVGDKMPEFRYSKWIKGEPIKQFDDNKIYIFEFWATWCGPCIQQMPHLSQIAKEYAGRAEVIGVNVWEK